MTIKPDEITGVKAEILRFIEENPGCTQRACARATAHTVNPTTVRERRRMINYLIEQGYVRDRERKDVGWSKLVLTAKARKVVALFNHLDRQ